MNLHLFKVFVTSMFFVCAAHASNKTETYSGPAKNDAGEIQYIENHEVTFNPSGNVLTAVTKYVRTNGQVIGTISSDFSTGLSAPDYTFTDNRDGSSHGLQNTADRITIWRQSKGKAREQKQYMKSEFPKDVLLVGCQGLHYYLVKNFDTVKQKKRMPLQYLIPGKLDAYKFTLQLLKEDEQNYFLKVKVDSLLLKMFVSSMDIKYRKSDNRLLSYSGLSNIPDDNGDIQNVNIEYSYKETL